LLATIAFMAQQEPYPGQSEHREPPENWFCARPGPNVPKDHECDCHRECTKDENGVNVEQEDRKCSVWCWQKHCTCPSKCSTTH
jgi:hypothetical protein